MGKARRYGAVRPGLKTGDIVLFSGKGGVSSSVKWVTLSPWSHVGMVLVIEGFDFVCLWESTASPVVADVEIGRICMGVQLVPLSQRVEQHDGEIALRSLQGVELSPADIRNLMQVRKQLARRPYEKSRIELMAAAWDGPLGNNREDLSSLFCSELVAEAYQALKLIRSGRHAPPSNEYVPADFSAAREKLPWLRGALGPEILLKS